MDAARTQKIAEVLKTVKQQGQQIRQPTAAAPAARAALLEAQSRLPIGLPGGFWVRAVMYFVAALLLIGVILLGIDQFVTPIFQRNPGGAGYIPVPGTDATQIFWKKASTVAEIPVAKPVSPADAEAADVIEGQPQYSITCDIYIEDEFPQELPSGQTERVFFMLGPSLSAPKIQLSIENQKNTLSATMFSADAARTQETAIIDNVPIRKPFRIGIVKKPKIIELYYNGKLVRTRQLRAIASDPGAGDKLYPPSSIIVSGKSLGAKIKVMNLRCFGYAADPNEMMGRMGDLMTKSDFIPSS